MPRGWLAIGLGMLALAPAAWPGGSARAQDPGGREAGLHGLAALATPSFAGGGVWLAYRPVGHTRVGVSIAPGSREGRAVVRGDLLLNYLLEPGKERGIGLYGVAGIAGITGPGESAYLVLGLGAETGPGAASGWWAEAGVGGGLRVAVGWRRRWLTRAGQMP